MYIAQGKSKEPALQLTAYGLQPHQPSPLFPWVGSTVAPVCSMAAEATIAKAAKVSINTTFVE